MCTSRGILVTDSLSWLFSTEQFMPHGHCYLWQPATLWLNVGSDALIATCYFAIPVVLYAYVRRRRFEIAFSWIALMFAGFIFLCGATHAMEIWTVWNPIYRLAGALKLVTGVVSLATLVSLVWITPRVMLLRTPLQLQAEVESRTLQLADVNRQLREEIKARDAAEMQLRSADRRKDEFLATLAHELRNPLAPIRHSLRLLDAPGVDQATRDWSSQVMTRQVSRMALLLDDLLDVSRITRGLLALRMETVELAAVMTSAIELAQPLMDEKHHEFLVTLPAERLYLRIDPLRMSQAVANLLTNAAKFTPSGGHISLTVRRLAAGVQIQVRDSGLGLDESSLDHVFEMFTQVASPGQSGGLGIGLALVKTLVDLHGGTVRAASEGLGKGSEFTIELPASVIQADEAAAELPAAQDAKSGIPPIKVLITDDNRDSADSLGLLLQSEGCNVVVTYFGAETMALAHLEKPDVVILDIGLPDVSGYDLARAVRAEPWGEKVLLLAMTGWGQAEDIARTKAAGFDRHFTKPIDFDVLLRSLREHAGARGLG